MSAVAVSDPSSSYWSSLVYIQSTFPSGATFAASGVMVGPNDVLTASHVLYMASQGGAATSVKIVPDYDSSPYQEPFGELYSNSFHYFANYDPTGSGLLMPGNNGEGLAGSELDIGIIDLSDAIGIRTGWMTLDPTFTSGTVNATGYPSYYGWDMMNDSGFAYAGTPDSIIVYNGLELHPGNSGGPVWYQAGDGAHVVGVVSTGMWGASVQGTYDQLQQWITANDSLIAGGITGLGGSSGGGTGGTITPPPDNTMPDTSGGSTNPPPPTSGTVDGTSGNDHLLGTAGNDTLTGRAGNDVLDSAGGSDVIDGGPGIDTAMYGARGNYNVAYANGSITVTDGSGTTDTLTGVERLHFSDALFLTRTPHAQLDLNGDHAADIVIRDLDAATVQIVGVSGTDATSMQTASMTGPIDWNIFGLGDFNGDGKGDILWQHDGGMTAIWTMNGANVLDYGCVTQGPVNATIAGTGDFNGDGRTDILWRATDGTVSTWQINDHSITGGGTVGQLSSDWRIAGTGDFDGDGKTDILWQQDNGAVAMWLMNGTAHTGGGTISSPPVDWRISGVGDFDGDGRSDILWRSDSGMGSIWLMNGEHIAGGWGTITEVVPVDSSIVGVGDFNGDHNSDILWQDVGGALKVELMDGLHGIGSGVVASLGSDWVVS